MYHGLMVSRQSLTDENGFDPGPCICGICCLECGTGTCFPGSTGGTDKSLARPTSRCILFDGENISFDATLVIHINSTNIPPIMIINRIYETQNLLSLKLVSFLVGLRTYQHPCTSVSLVSVTVHVFLSHLSSICR